MKRTLAVAVCLALPMLFSSCVAAVAAVGAGGVAYWQYSKNEVVGEFSADLERTWEATLAELAEQGLGAPTEQECGLTEGTVRGEDWRVRLERVTGDRTHVRVRIGTFDTRDHERRSELLLEGIAARLGTTWVDPEATAADD